ncbi:MAG TPA: GTPase Era [Candidatus Scatomorpha merdipullorum]|uniref:GTPase Era n=1 Tax=Candidatus Scatomorpha merdipullorum TaxID=2840927 RepID=A0A9D1FEK3_9FIRM|nr:GTPase Era [Candidatus Scatomorpha merdipullorum]
MITVAGRPNVGKSTLTNALVGEKVAIVSNKPQTTRGRITGVVARGETQFVFMDTPGFHRARTRLGEYMDKVVRESVSDVDAVVLVVEPIASVGRQEAELIRQIRNSGVPAVLAVNKIDTVEKPELLSVIAAYAAAHDFAAIVPISAKTGEGLDALMDELEGFAEEGPHLFPDDVFTDQPEKQLCAEIIREKLLWCLEREVPHGTAVVVTRFEEREDGVVELDATIYCEKASHKGIIIGRQGAMLKKIGEMARRDMETLLDTKVFLQTWVKVKENWRDSQPLLRNFGFTEQ